MDVMKNWKVYGIIITVVLVVFIVGFCLYMFLFRETITEAEAQNIAYQYAGVNASDVTILTIQKDREDREYEIRFYDDVYEYEIDVNYNNGNVRNFEKDLRENININQGQNNTTVSMTEDEARSIALQRVGKTSEEVTFTRVRIDRENGATVYDVYFYDTEKEYELSIDVDTKEVVSYKEDYLVNGGSSVTNPNTTTTNYIGADKVKEIVLNHAGLSSSDVRFSKVELDVDYHIATYELEFYYNYFEYDYEVDAMTGEILKYERGR